MKKTLHKRKPGEMEIRILRDGRVAFVAPDDGLVAVARRMLAPGSRVGAGKKERKP